MPVYRTHLANCSEI